MALLAIDQGNTRTKFGLFTAGALQRVWTITTRKDATADELASAAFTQHRLPDDLHVGLCSVVPELVPCWATAVGGRGLTIITGETPTPLLNSYATPATLGADRLMMAVAAAERVGAPVIPISLGTATVVDAVSADGAYLGGMIAPGIAVTAQALATAASALGTVAWQPPAAAIGRSSADAMTSGLFYQSIGGLRAMVEAIRQELQHPHAPLALTGGWAKTLAPYLHHVAVVDPSLVLQGIAVTLRAYSEC